MLVLLCGLLLTGAHGATVQEHTSQLSKTWSRMLEPKSSTTPVDRAVNLLKEMQVTLEKDMEEDEALYGKLACWCRDNTKDKKKAIKTNTAKVADLQASIEEGTASSANLKAKIKELEAEVADNKATLGKATALREKETLAFSSGEKDGVANIANLKSAIVVLSKHHGAAALPQLSALTFLQTQSQKDEPYGLENQDQRDLDMFMSSSDTFDVKSEGRFLQQATPAQTQVQRAEDGWTADDVIQVQTALKAASAFVQRRGQDASTYVPGYEAQSGEIFGVLRQLKEDMESDLSDSQKLEAKRAADFSELRKAKTAEIEGGEKSSEEKEDELSKTDNDLAEAKEDLGQTEATLAEDRKFAENLKKTCDEADANFAHRKKARLAETQAVSEAVEILSADEAKDAMKGTFKKKSFFFLQLSSKRNTENRRQAAKLLRRQAAVSGSPELALLASSTEIDAFTKVNGMIDRMVQTLNTQQSDEVKRNDWCTKEIQSNDMATMKAKDRRADLDASSEERKMAIKKFEEDVGSAKSDINKEQVSLQEATKNRKKENLDFQKTVADQTLTIAVLEKAMDRLATYYDDQALIQTHEVHHSQQAPPVAQMKYKPSMGSGGVLSLIEKLIYDAKEIMAESKKSEQESQAAYEEMVSDSNGTIKTLTKTVLSKTDAKVEAHKDLTQKTLDLKATNRELDGLGKTDTDLHADCDYLLKNFNVRQEARSQEVAALKQAKSILSGASA